MGHEMGLGVDFIRDKTIHIITKFSTLLAFTQRDLDWRENVKYYFPKFETWKYWRTNKNRRANKNVYFSEFYFISTAKLWTSGWKCFVYFVIKGKKVLAIWLFLIKIAKLSRHIELSSSWWSSKIFTVVIRIITRCWCARTVACPAPSGVMSCWHNLVNYHL